MEVVITQDIFNAVVQYLQSQGYALIQGGHQENFLFTQHKTTEFLQDPRFIAAYQAGKTTGQWPIEVPWRVLTACWAGEQASKLGGDFVECGVNNGSFVRAMIEYLHFEKLPQQFYLLDTFNGLVQEQFSEQENALGLYEHYKDHYGDCYEVVKKTFAPYKNVKLIRGMVPDTLSQIDSDKIAFLSLDMNCAAPEVQAIEYLWDKLVPGAVVLLDDYGWDLHIEQKNALDLFAKEHNHDILLLATGQGLLIKRP